MVGHGKEDDLTKSNVAVNQRETKTCHPNSTLVMYFSYTAKTYLLPTNNHRSLVRGTWPCHGLQHWVLKPAVVSFLVPLTAATSCSSALWTKRVNNKSIYIPCLVKVETETVIFFVSVSYLRSLKHRFVSEMTIRFTKERTLCKTVIWIWGNKLMQTSRTISYLT